MQRETEPISEREREISSLLTSNPHLTLKQIACLAGVDRHKIQREIRERHGCSFRALKNDIRLARACALLTEQHPKYCIKEIAAEIGITPNALSRLIKSMTGYCATELRRLK
jgi:AraC-like DNA-binding protein